MNRRQIIRRNVTLLVAVTLLAALAIIGWAALAAQHAGSGEPVLETALGLTATGGITGTVLDETDQTPIEGILIWAKLTEYYPFGGDWLQTTTNISGTYTFEALDPGDYLVYAPGSFLYSGEWYQETSWGHDATPVTVTGGEMAEGIDLTLEPMGAISGTVYADDGVTPLAGVNLQGSKQLSSGWGWATTDENGAFAMGGLDGGAWKIYAYGAEDHAWEYYGDTRDEGEALTIDVVLGEVTENIDMVLDPGATITGTVYQDDGVTPLEGVEVKAQHTGNGRSNDRVVTDANGRFTCKGLAPGDHTVRSFGNMDWCGEYYDDSVNLEGATPVSLALGATVANCDFSLEEAGFISGHVFGEDGITPQHDIGVNASSGQEYRSTLTHIGGAYRIGGLRGGTYTVRTEHMSYVDGQHDQIVVSAGEETTDVDFALSIRNPATVSGHVYADDGVTPVEGVQVCVANRYYPNSGMAYRAVSDINGAYALTNIRHDFFGYYVYAYSSSHAREYYEEAPDRDSATELDIGEGDVITDIDFTLDEQYRMFLPKVGR